MGDNRIEIIKELLIKNKRVYVNNLSDELGVSKVSVRKYLAKLEDEGFALRFYGGASIIDKGHKLDSSDSFYSDPLLNALAREAEKQVVDGDSIFIGSGRSCCVLARQLAGKKNLTIVTNNITALPEMINNAARVYLIGGEVTSTDNRTLFSSWESPETIMNNIFVNKAFTSTAGIDMKAGLTVDSIISTHIFKQLPTMAHSWYLMADSTKFDKRSIYSVADLDQIDTLITDHVPQHYEAKLAELKTNIITTEEVH